MRRRAWARGVSKKDICLPDVRVGSGHGLSPSRAARAPAAAPEAPRLPADPRLRPGKSGHDGGGPRRGAGRRGCDRCGGALDACPVRRALGRRWVPHPRSYSSQSAGRSSSIASKGSTRTRAASRQVSAGSHRRPGPSVNTSSVRAIAADELGDLAWRDGFKVGVGGALALPGGLAHGRSLPGSRRQSTVCKGPEGVGSGKRR